MINDNFDDHKGVKYRKKILALKIFKNKNKTKIIKIVKNIKMLFPGMK